MSYGIPYMGSKSAIAEDIIANLPSGKRLVDLFGGGFAISHCALLSYKWKSVLYNDINPLLIPLIKDAISGKYSYERFTPEWISREDFMAKKDTDGYVKWCWSFGNDGKTYLYGKDIEETKHKMHDFCVYGRKTDEIELNPDDYSSPRERRIALYKKDCKIENLERLERLQNLEALERLQSVEGVKTGNLEMTCMDYQDYKYQDGDVVYCDIPYQNNSGKKDYDGKFDFGAFYSWAISRPFPVYFSSYKLGGVVWEQDKNVLKGSSTNDQVRREVLYCADNNFSDHEIIYQGYLFKQQI